MKTPIAINTAIIAQDASLRLRAGDFSAAGKFYLQILEREPQHREALVNMWQLLLLQGKLEESREYEGRFFSLEPAASDVLIRKGRFLHVLGKYADALECFNRALAMGSKTVEVYQGIGDALLDQGHADGAIEYYEKALKLQPKNANLHALLAEACRGMNRFDETFSYARKALALDPTLAFSQCTIAWTHLLLGDYKTGLALNEKRFTYKSREFLTGMGILPNMEKFSSKPRWQGQDLQGKTLLVWSEQGLGDNIMMMRYVPLLAQKGVGSVIIYTQQGLVKLMLTMTSQVVGSQYDLSSDVYDLQCSIMSLPYLFGTTLASIPANSPYLQIVPEKKRRWDEQLGRFSGLKIGIAWAGSKAQGKDRLRSVELTQFAPFLDLPGAHFVSLQKDDAAAQLDDGNWRILNFMDACEDLLETAALISTLDLIITVDTVIAHLAGALGKPVWLLNRFESEWRWLMEREDSPWYPTLRIFRQPSSHDWANVTMRIADELRKMSAEQTGAPMSQTEWEKAYQSASKALGIRKASPNKVPGVLRKFTSFFR